MDKVPEHDARARVDEETADRIELAERARTVVRILERCEEELARLELVPHSGAGDVNAISMAKGYTQRARSALLSRFA